MSTKEWNGELQRTQPGENERYATVEFLAENGATANVSVDWIKNKRIGSVNDKKAILGKCHWPPKHLEGKVRKLAEAHSKPDKTWVQHDVEILRFWDSLKDAARFTSNISGLEADASDDSEDLELVARKEKARKSRRRRESENQEGSDSNCSEELDVSFLNINKKARTDAPQQQKNTRQDKADSGTPKKISYQSPSKNISRQSPTKNISRQERMGRGSPRKDTFLEDMVDLESPRKAISRQETSGVGSPATKKRSASGTQGSDSNDKSASSPKTPKVTPFRDFFSRKVTPLKTPQKSSGSKGSVASLPRMKSLSPAKGNAASDVSRPGSPASSSGVSSRAPKRSSPTASLSSMSITEESLDLLQKELEGICASPRSNGTASPSVSEVSEASFKTPRDKSAYRSLNYTSPSDAAGYRRLITLFADFDEHQKEINRQLKVINTSMRKIMSCVLPPIESNIAADIPRLPLSDRESEKKLNELITSTEEFNKVVTFLYGLGGTSPRDAVYNILKSLFTDEFASTKSMKGIKRSNNPSKDAFLGTELFKAVQSAVRRRFTETSLAQVIELTGNWLKDAPAREKKRQRRLTAREEFLRSQERH